MNPFNRKKRKIFAKKGTSPRLECKYAVKIDFDTKQRITLELFPLYLDCQNNLYEVDILDKDVFKPIPSSSLIKNNTQLKTHQQKTQQN